MSVFVEPALVRDAYARAARRPLTAEEEHRWARVLAWAGSARRTGRLAEDVASVAPLLEVFTGHHRDPAGGPPPADPDLVARLRSWFADRGVRLERVAVIPGGFSRLMLDAVCDGDRVVVRVEQGGLFATEGHREVAVMRAVADLGYPVPAVRWQEPDPAVLGHPFFVMQHVAGSARTDDAGVDDLVRAVAALHRLDAVGAVAGVDGLRDAGPEAVVAAQLEHWHAVYRAAVPDAVPLLERALGWLRGNLRPTGPTVVVHGDPGPGNALQDERGVVAVIDWEFAHAGDAAEDWAYLALIRGRRLATPQEWRRRLHDVVGVGYDDATWRAWDVYNQVKGACVNLTALEVFRASASPTPDLLAIGVAVHLRFLARAVELIDEVERPRGGQPDRSDRSRWLWSW